MQENLEVNTDGGARGNPGPGAAAFVVRNETREIYKEGKYLGITTNNVAEYQGVLMALAWLNRQESSLETVVFNLDSELVVKQLNGVYKIRNKVLTDLVIKIKKLEKAMNTKITYQHVRRSQNKIADSLVNRVLDRLIDSST